jgi:hypothetical protein
MADDTTPEAPQAFDPTSLDDAALAAEFARVAKRGHELSAKAEFAAGEAEELDQLAERLPQLQAETAARIERATAAQAKRDAFASVEVPVIPAVTPLAPVAAPVAAEQTPEAPQVPSVPSVAEMAAQAPVPAAPARRRDRTSIAFSSDAAGVLRKSVGEDATIREIGEASSRLFAQFGTSRVGGGIRAERALAQFTREREFRISGDRDRDAETLTQLRDQKRLDGGSLLKAWEKSVTEGGTSMGALTAAAGWCAPSENDYDLCSLWTSDGLIDLPTASAPRGGVNYTNDWSWAQINDAALTSFTKLTEAQVIADTAKNCTELPCPTFTERRLDVAVTCITGSFLQDTGYRENVATLIDGLTLKHEVNVNRDIIAQMVTAAGAAVVIPGQGATVVGQTPDTSAVSSILSAVDIAAIDMRYREHMSENQVLEVVLPQWILAQWRADIGRRNAWYTDPFALANSTIMGWFSTRNIRPQFVRDWQDNPSGLATGPGDITAPITFLTSLPSTVQFLLYPAGAVVLLREDVVTLTNVYDSTNLKQNLYTALFTEEGYAPIFPCGEIKLYTAQACPSGATGHQVYTSCAVPAA